MELPRRAKGDELLKAGELASLRKRLRNIGAKHDLASVIACAFDHRTRMLPFIYADLRMVPAGVRAVASAMVDAGFAKTRIVLQQWNRRFRPSQMRLDGRIPDLFMVSSMQLHGEQCMGMIRDACRIDPAHRPLIIAGGAKAIYEPWDFFAPDPSDAAGADVVVTGEEFVLLSLLEVLLSVRANGEPMRSAFIRARDGGMLDEIPGLVYARTDETGMPVELVDTGIQRLLGDLNELPHPVLGYRLLEPPSRKATLASQAVPANRVRRLSPIGSLVLTLGCKLKCSYCPIPAYNQRQLRTKTGERVADEMYQLYREYGIRHFFGADDNFFADRDRALEIAMTLSQMRLDGVRVRSKVRWGTEVTVHDTHRLKRFLPLFRDAGLRALWLGVEDMTATLVKKGQSVEKTTEVFRLLQRHGICPMPMMMHSDEQPLYTRGRPYGLLNQARLLRKAGAVSIQALMVTPATGSKLYEECFTSGMMYASVGGRRIEPYTIDGNYVVASNHPKPWRKQFNIILTYVYFYNPLRFLIALAWPKSRLYLADAGMQALGMYGLTKTIRRTLWHALRLIRCKIERTTGPPVSRIPMRSPDGGAASHDLPDTPEPNTDVKTSKEPAACPP